MAKLNPYQTREGPFAAFNEFDAVAKVASTAASTAENIAVPDEAQVVCLQSDSDIWYEADATASIPSADAASGSSIYLPAGERRFVICQGVSNISVISASTALVSALFWDRD